MKDVSVNIAVIAAISAVLSTVISAIILYLNRKAVSRQKIAEFRKEWIENLRQHLGEYVSVAYKRNVTNKAYDRARKNNPEEAHAEREELVRLNERFGYLHSYILMNLNPQEDAHLALEKRMKQILKFEKQTDSKTPGLVQLARDVMKKEWDRLKEEIK